MMTRRFARLRSAITDPRLVLGVCLVVVAVAVSSLVSRTDGRSVEVLAAARDLSVGSKITAADLVVVSMQIDDAARRRLVAMDDLASTASSTLTRSLRAGELLTQSAFGRQERSLAEVVVPIPAELAPGLRLSAGDLVDVVTTLSNNSSDARSVVVARSVEVLSVEGDLRDDAPLSSSGALFVTLGTRSRDALAIVFSLHNGEISLVRSAGGEQRLPDEMTAASIGSRA